jgi:hypothetical protein
VFCDAIKESGGKTAKLELERRSLDISKRFDGKVGGESDRNQPQLPSFY